MQVALHSKTKYFGLVFKHLVLHQYHRPYSYTNVSIYMSYKHDMNFICGFTSDILVWYRYSCAQSGVYYTYYTWSSVRVYTKFIFCNQMQNVHSLETLQIIIIIFNMLSLEIISHYYNYKLLEEHCEFIQMLCL